MSNAGLRTDGPNSVGAGGPDPVGDISVLYVDPDATAGTPPLRELVADPAIEVARETTVADAVAALRERIVDCVVTEYDLADGTGMELVARLREIAPDTGAILVTEAAPARIAAESAGGPVADFVPKSVPDVGDRVVRLVKHTAANRSQTSYPLPADERARLDALAAIDLDDERLGRAVQRVTELAATHFAVPHSSVNVITERTQEFLASTGGEFEPTPREESACTYTILDDGVSVIEDVAVDPRFPGAADDPAIRFYAGATLTTREGHPVGTLCVYDDEPRPFGETDRAYLSLLAAEVTDWLEVARETGTESGLGAGEGEPP